MCQHKIGQDEFDKLIEPIVNPSGIWADYNAVLYYHKKLVFLANTGIIDGNCLPPPPSVSDYTDYASSRSEMWGTPRFPYGPIIPTNHLTYGFDDPDGFLF